jgi:hypothetical protein
MLRILLLGVILSAGASSAIAQETTTYTYDVHGRLIAVDRSTSVDTDYAYDDGNSRTEKVTTGAAAMARQAETLPEDVPELEPQPPLPEDDEQD